MYELREWKILDDWKQKHKETIKKIMQELNGVSYHDAIKILHCIESNLDLNSFVSADTPTARCESQSALQDKVLQNAQE